MDYRQVNAIRKKKEVALDGLPDKNVFDIQQGVAFDNQIFKEKAA